MSRLNKILVLLFLSLNIYCEDIIPGLIGGDIILPSDPVRQPYAASVSSLGTVTPLSPLPSQGSIRDVALNDANLGLIGGNTQPNSSETGLYAAFISSSQVQPISLPTFPPGIHAQIKNVALNQSNLGLIGGFARSSIFSSVRYAAFVSPTTLTPLEIAFPPMDGVINAVAINNSNIGLLGGFEGPAFFSDIYAAFVTPDSLTPQPISFPVPSDSIFSVSLNDLGQGLMGGLRASEGIAYFVSIDSTTASAIDLGPNVEILLEVAINLSNVGLVGGVSTGSGAYAAFVFPNAETQILSNLPTDGAIESVAINKVGQGLIGGSDGGAAYAAFVNVGSAPRPLSGLPTGIINSVAINDFGQGLIGGGNFNTNVTYAAIVLPSGQLIPLSLGFSGEINSVAINSFMLTQLPTSGLHGNNLIFAGYINANAPQNAIYFVPALIDGTFTSALESAAPTRNAISFNTVMQNAFYLTTNLSTHLREERWIQSRASNSKNVAALHKEPDELQNELLASKRLVGRPAKQKATCKPKPFTLWFDAIGAFAYQKSQHQTPGFNPNTGAVTLAFDGRVTDEVIVGGGASYLYTHVHENQGTGKSHINQEDLFLYSSWQPNEFYLDLALWGGLFQTNQIRYINMTGFKFHSQSSPHGWQLIPHLELGWEAFAKKSATYEVTWNILGMLDWANAWQNSYKEKGNSPFNIQQKSHYGSLLRTEAGLRFSETFFYSCWNLILLEKASYVNIQSLSGAGKVPAVLLGSPGSFTVETLTGSQNLGAVQFGITAAPYKIWYPASTLFYQGEFGSRYQSHQLTLELAWNF